MFGSSYSFIWTGVCSVTPSVCLSSECVEVRRWTLQNGQILPVCHRRSTAARLCGHQLSGESGETRIGGCAGPFRPQTRQHGQVSHFYRVKAPPPHPVADKAVSCFSISLPEKLEYAANKYAEHCHDKWSSEKVCPGRSHVRMKGWAFIMMRLLLQMSAGWKHGDSLDEQAKAHPLLKPFKALSEKVTAAESHTLKRVSRVTVVRGSAGKRDVPLACEGGAEEHAGYGLEHREDQGGRSHVPATREWKAETPVRVPGPFENVCFHHSCGTEVERWSVTPGSISSLSSQESEGSSPECFRKEQTSSIITDIFYLNKRLPPGQTPSIIRDVFHLNKRIPPRQTSSTGAQTSSIMTVIFHRDRRPSSGQTSSTWTDVFRHFRRLSLKWTSSIWTDVFHQDGLLSSGRTSSILIDVFHLDRRLPPGQTSSTGAYLKIASLCF